MARGRPKQFTCSEEEFKKYILKYHVNENGTKRPVRDIINLQEFMDNTGYFRINKYTKKQEPRSLGSITYWTGKKFQITEKDIFDYHQRETFKIQPEITFEEWTRKNNKNSSKKRKFSLKDYEDFDKVKKIIKKTCKEAKYNDYLNDFSSDYKYISVFNNMCFEFGNSKIENIFKKLYKAGD